MTVSFRNTSATLAAIGAASGLMMALALPAMAGGAGAMSQSTTQPEPSPAPGHSSGHSSGHSGGCASRCNGNPGTLVHTPRVRIPSPTVVIGIPEVGGSNSFVFGGGGFGGQTSSLIISGGAQNNFATVFVGGGGGDAGLGGGFYSEVSALAVEGEFTETVTEKVPEYSERTTLKQIAIRAVCLDGSDTPHPASQVDPDMMIPDHFLGEIYRCMAGTSMAVTLGEVINGKPVFDNGRTLNCDKGQALRLAAGGQLQCTTQEPRRNCNERSLLRKFGPGIKVLTASAVEKHVTYKEVTRQVTRQTSKEFGPILFDGGVGGGY
jgi:hypothetical protein